MSKRKVSVEDKICAVNLASVQQWIRNYESMGANAFTLKGNKKYSKELKQQSRGFRKDTITNRYKENR